MVSKKNEKPLVSIIIPTYNRANFLPQTIKSALQQTYQNTEILIIDDGSTDNTKQIVKKIQNKYKKIKYFWQKNSGGAAKPKNKGIKKSKGDYIAVLDSDDEYYPNKIEEQIKIFKTKQSKKLMAVGSYAKEIYMDTKEERVFKVPNYKEPLKELLKHDYMGSGSTMMYKKKLFDKIGHFDENLKSGQDAEMRIRIAVNGFGFHFAQKPLFKYKIHQQGMSESITAKKKSKDVEYIFNKYKKYYTEDSKIYSIKLRYDGTRNMYLNNKTKAREKFIKSIKNNPANIRSYLYLFFSLFGTSFYKKLNSIRHRIKGFFKSID